MTRPVIGKQKWNKALKRGLDTTQEQMDRVSQLRAALRQLLPDDETNGEAYEFIFHLMVLLDDLAELGVSHQKIYQELWEIGQGRPYKDLNNDK